METSRALYEDLLLLGAAHGIFLAVALSLVRSGNRVALRLLALLTAAFAIDLGTNYLNVSDVLEQYPRLIFVEWAAAFLYGPLLYLYVLALTASKAWRLSLGQLLHLLPFAISIALMVPLLRLPDPVLVDMVYAGADAKISG